MRFVYTPVSEPSISKIRAKGETVQSQSNLAKYLGWSHSSMVIIVFYGAAT